MDEKEVRESCGHEALTQVSPVPLLGLLLSLLLSLDLLCLWLEVVCAADQAHLQRQGRWLWAP